MVGPLRAIDLFSGSGGVTEGYKSAGIAVRAAVDTDEISRRTYQANHPEVKLCSDDIHLLPPIELIGRIGLRPGELDVLTACAPCQTFSSLGARHRKADDPRNGLVEKIGEFAGDILPRAVVMENVPNLASEDRFQSLVNRLHGLGYGVRFEVVNAADFGVPQRRHRLVMIALRDSADEDVPEMTPRHPLLRDLSVRRTVRDAFSELALILTSDDPLAAARIDYPETVKRRIEAIPANGGSRSSLPSNLSLPCHQRLKAGSNSGASNIYGRMAWDEPAPTLTTRCTSPSCGRFLHPTEDRAITLREAACLQTFPSDYKFAGGVMDIQRQIGNAVPPRLAQAIAIVVSEALRRRTTGVPISHAV